MSKKAFGRKVAPTADEFKLKLRSDVCNDIIETKQTGQKWYKWKMFLEVEAPPGKEKKFEKMIKKINYNLPESFNPPLVVSTDKPWAVDDKCYMGFQIKLEVFYSNGKSDQFDYDLKIPGVGEPRRKASKLCTPAACFEKADKKRGSFSAQGKKASPKDKKRASVSTQESQGSPKLDKRRGSVLGQGSPAANGGGSSSGSGGSGAGSATLGTTPRQGKSPLPAGKSGESMRVSAPPTKLAGSAPLLAVGSTETKRVRTSPNGGKGDDGIDLKSPPKEARVASTQPTKTPGKSKVAKEKAVNEKVLSKHELKAAAGKRKQYRQLQRNRERDTRAKTAWEEDPRHRRVDDLKKGLETLEEENEGAKLEKLGSLVKRYFKDQNHLLTEYPDGEPTVETIQFDLYTLSPSALDELNKLIRNPVKK